MTTQRPILSGQAGRRTQRVLLVDDDPTHQAMLNVLFENWQWDVFEASSSREALEILERHTIDLVLLDAASQGADCPDLVAALGPQVRERPIIVMGAVMTEQLRRVWRSRGAMECLGKPVEPRTLSALLGALGPPSGFADS